MGEGAEVPERSAGRRTPCTSFRDFCPFAHELVDRLDQSERWLAVDIILAPNGLTPLPRQDHLRLLDPRTCRGRGRGTSGSLNRKEAPQGSLRDSFTRSVAKIPPVPGALSGVRLGCCCRAEKGDEGEDGTNKSPWGPTTGNRPRRTILRVGNGPVVPLKSQVKASAWHRPRRTR